MPGNSTSELRNRSLEPKAQDVHEDGKKEKIVEDAKGVQTTDFKIKMKLMKAVNNIEIKISKKK